MWCRERPARGSCGSRPTIGSQNTSSVGKLPRFSSPGFSTSAMRDSSTSEFGEFVSPTLGLSKKLSFGSEAVPPGHGVIGEGAQPLRVVCRVRPMRPDELSHGEPVVKVDGPAVLRLTGAASAAPAGGGAPAPVTSDGTVFTFDRVFDDTTTQAEMFTGSFRHIVESAVHCGSNGLLFAYGMTNAGKTFTINGTDTQPGLIPRVLHTIFSEVQRARADGHAPSPAGESAKVVSPAAGPIIPAGAQPSSSSSSSAAAKRAVPPAWVGKMTVAVSYLEIYNEQVFDLLADSAAQDVDAATMRAMGGNTTTTGGGSTAVGGQHAEVTDDSGAAIPLIGPGGRLALRLKDGADGRVHVRGLRTVTVPRLQRALEIMKQGAMNKQVCPQLMSPPQRMNHPQTDDDHVGGGVRWQRLR